MRSEEEIKQRLSLIENSYHAQYDVGFGAALEWVLSGTDSKPIKPVKWHNIDRDQIDALVVGVNDLIKVVNEKRLK